MLTRRNVSVDQQAMGLHFGDDPWLWGSGALRQENDHNVLRALQWESSSGHCPKLAKQPHVVSFQVSLSRALMVFNFKVRC